MADLIERGFARNSHLGWDQHVVAIMHGGEAAAFICWTYNDDYCEAVIHLGGVAEHFRRQGLYRIAFASLADQVRRRYPAATAIVSGFHVDNPASGPMQLATGRAIDPYRTTRYSLEAP